MIYSKLNIPHELKENQANSVTLLRRRFSEYQLKNSREASGRLRGWVTAGETKEVKIKGLPAYLSFPRATQLLQQSYLKFQRGAIEVLPKGLGGGTKHTRPVTTLESNQAETCEEEALQIQKPSVSDINSLVEAISNEEKREKVRKIVEMLLENDPKEKDLNTSAMGTIGAEGAKALAAALKVNQSIQTLNLVYKHLSNEGVQTLTAALRVNQSIHTLSFYCSYIGDVGAQALRTALRVNQSIQSLSLWKNQIGAEGAQAFGSALQVNHTLQSLDLCDNQIGDEGAQALAAALQVNQLLLSLSLKSNQIGAVGTQALGIALQINQSLLSLSLSINRIGVAGAQALGAALQVNQSLQSLNLWGNHIGDAGAQALGIALEVNHTLQSLDLKSNHIGDVGTQTLGVALQVNHTLQLLNISMNQIGAAGVQALGAGLEINHTLQSLFLYYNQIDNVGIQALEAALQINDTLQALSFVENQIGATGIITEKRIKTLLQANKQIATLFQQQIAQVQNFLHSHENNDGILLEHLPQLKKLLSKWHTNSKNIIPSLQEILRQSGKTNLNDRHKEKLEGIIKDLTNRLHNLWLESFEKKIAALSNKYVMGKESSEKRNVDLGHALYDMWLTFVSSDCPNWIEDHIQSLIPFAVLLDIAKGKDKQDISELKDPYSLFQRVLSFRNELKDPPCNLTSQS